ncbi:hypothetical protein [Catenovulum sediminis]|uniref:Sulfotransferase family protein n=1 Tax=Catenovulum sediminis TaxID=1740262 RepID=A0ABV1RMG2_9ALTE
MRNECRIAMWSGPRNISTAMMRAFENRADSCVVDEPLYAYYLQQTGLQHPARAEILASMSTRWQLVAEQLTQGALDTNCTVYYQKHMTHHVLPEVDLAFTKHLKNVFLLREPAKIINSYAKVRPQFSIDELGVVQQWHIYQYCLANNTVPPIVMDSQWVLSEPKKALSALCSQLHIPFSEKMLCWPKGKRQSDGVWAPYWYANVEASCGFEKANDTVVQVAPQYQKIYQQAREIYLKMQRSATLIADKSSAEVY